MRNYLIVLLFVFISCSQPSPKPNIPYGYEFPSGDTFTVMTWNIENFVDRFDSPYINNRTENTAEVSSQKVAGFGEVLRRAAADVIVFQEVESRPFILALIDSLVPEMMYQFSASSESPNWHQNVVVISRFPLGPMLGFGSTHSPVYSDIDSLGNTKTQSMINTRIVTTPVFVRPNYSFLLTGVHLKAGRGNRNKGMRKGQMELIIKETERLGYSNKLITGDFNTVPDSSDFEYLKQMGFYDLFGGPTPFSHPADSVFWRLDHIMPNGDMKNEYLSNSVKVFTPFSPDSMNAISDHLPILASFYTIDR